MKTEVAVAASEAVLTLMPERMTELDALLAKASGPALATALADVAAIALAAGRITAVRAMLLAHAERVTGTVVLAPLSGRPRTAAPRLQHPRLAQPRDWSDCL